MKHYPFMQVDAFTERPLAGNPCAVVLDADGFSPALMLSIAKEMNLSETAFVSASSSCDFSLRFFTPAEEIPLAGHPTIASVYALIESGRLKLSGDLTEVRLELLDGPIKVEIDQMSNGKITIWMTQRTPTFLRTYDPEEVMPVFGLGVGDVQPGYPIQTVSTGTPQLMIPVKNQNLLRSALVNVPAYVHLRESGDFFSPHLFCIGGFTRDGDTFARHFGIPPDTPEDPFTGSATGGMAAYLWRYDLIEKPTFTAEQGHWMGRPGTAHVQIIGSRSKIKSVKVGGQAVTVIIGELSLPIN